MANASVVIKGVNQMSKAVNSAVSDLGKIKDAAAKASKTLLSAFELGTAVAVIKKATKAAKEYINTTSSLEVKKSVTEIKENWQSIKDSISSVLDKKLEPVFARISQKTSEIRDNFANMSSTIEGIFDNIPQALAIVTVGAIEIIKALLSWENLKEIFTSIWDGIIESAGNLGIAIADKIKNDIQEISDKFENTEMYKFLKEMYDAFTVEQNPFILQGTTTPTYQATDATDLYYSPTTTRTKGTTKPNLPIILEQTAIDMEDTVSNLNQSVDNIKTTTTELLAETYDVVIDTVTEVGGTVYDTIKPILDDIFEKLQALRKKDSEDITSEQSSTSVLTSKRLNTFLTDNILTPLKTAFASFIQLAQNPAVTALSRIITSFANTMTTMLNTTLQPLMDVLDWIGSSLAQVFLPIMDALYPILQTIAQILTSVFSPVLQIMSPVIEMIASVLQILQPILILVADAFTILFAPVKYIADLFGWLGQWVSYLGSCIGTAIYNISHPFSAKDYGTAPGAFSSNAFNLQSRLGTGAMGGSAVTDSVSTATAVTSASYQGATQVTINIYQEAPVVGDGGMRTFARMIKEEFSALDYYGIA